MKNKIDPMLILFVGEVTIRCEAAIPRADVHEHCAKDDGR